MKLCVLISGSGTNLQAIINAIQDKTLAAEIVLVVSNRQAAYGLERAVNAKIPTLYFPLKPYKDRGLTREQYDIELAKRLQEYQPDVIVLAGWMHILSSAFLSRFPRVINLHPALPGVFAGTDAIQRAYDAFQRGEISHSGCMVHYAVPDVDAGEVIMQKVVPLYPDDSLESFKARMHQTEHEILVAALQRMAHLGT